MAMPISSTRRARGDLKEPRHLAVGDGDAVGLGVLLHLGEQSRVRREQPFEVLGLFGPDDGVETRLHILDSALRFFRAGKSISSGSGQANSLFRCRNYPAR